MHALKHTAKVSVQLQLLDGVEEEADLGRRRTPVVESLLEVLAVERRFKPVPAPASLRETS